MPIVERDIQGHIELKDVMNFVAQEGKEFKIQTTVGDYNYIPTRNVKLTVDSAAVIETGTVKPEDAGRIVKEMKWRIKGSSITKNHLMVMDIIANNNWERPVYFAVTVGGDNYLGLEKYFRLEGLAYQVVPVEAANTDGQTGEIEPDIMYENFVNKFEWGNMHRPDVYHGTETERMSLNYRSMFARLANALIADGQPEKARQALERCMESIPGESIPYNFSMLGIVEAYHKLGDHEKANEIAMDLADVMKKELVYYTRFDKSQVNRLDNEPRIAMSVLQKLALEARMNAPNPRLDTANLTPDTLEMLDKQAEHYELMDSLFLEMQELYYNSPLAVEQ